jgi:putative membrane-bound dehydrogenase-like protein
MAKCCAQIAASKLPRPMKRVLPFVVAALASAFSPASAQTSPLRIFLRGGPKTHGEGEHDHPKFVDDWKALLSERGAVVDGALTFPTAEQLARTDVLVLYAAEGGTIHGADRDNLDAYLKRGGGIVALHDAVCGDDSQWFKTVIGGAWEHGVAKYLEGTTDLYVTGEKSPITDGAENFRFEDEIYWELHMMPEAKVLMTGFHTVFDITPQMWTYEKDNYRAFVSIQGHYRESFSHPAWRTLLLRGIAWAGKRDVGLLLKAGEAEALKYPLGGPTKPEDASKLIDLHPDFDLSLVAAEPLVVKPISIDWDPRGRMWVAMTPGYPEKERFSKIPAHDEIAILTDKNGDGRMDERKTFFKGLDLVTSFVFHRDGLIVTQAPDILFLRDTDGDDVCDKQETLFTGFGFGDTHAVMSGMRWGMDGWIYATQGYSGNDSKHITNAAGKDFGKIGNGLFRFRPDGSAIEMVSSYGSNTWGCSCSPDGELFFTMANGAHLRHVVVPEHFLEGNRIDNVESWVDIPDHDRVFPAVVRTDAPYAQIDFVGGFTAAAGSCFYDGGAWPNEWNTSHFVCEPTVNLVHHDVITPNGVTFKATKAREQEFITSRDLWFRPVDVRVGPDGALYVLDFYNQAVVHNDTRGPKHGPTNFAIRPDRDHEHGRIWRVQNKKAQPAVVALPIPTAPDKAVALLDSPSAWVRNTAERLLVEHADANTASLIKHYIADPNLNFGCMHGAWALQRLDAYDADTAAWMAKDAVNIRSASTFARILAEQARKAPESTPSESVLDCLLEKNPRLTLLALCVLGDTGIEQIFSKEEILENATSRDAWTRSVAARAVSHDVPSFLYTIRNGYLRPRAIDLAVDATHVAIHRDGIRAAAGILAEIAAPADSRFLEFRVAVLVALAAEAKPESAMVAAPSVKESLAQLLTDGDERIAIAALSLVSRWKLDDALAANTKQVAERLQMKLANSKETPELRVKALSALLTIPGRRTASIAAGKDLLAKSSSPEQQLATLDALSKTDDVAAASVIADSYSGLASAARDRAFELLAARASWANELLTRVEAQSIAAADLGPQKMHRLRNHPDAATSQRATKLFESLAGASNAKINELIAKLLPDVDKPGDRAHGKELFKQNCATCHTAFGEGAKVGPDISGMGAHGARDLLPIILDPNRTVEAAFAEWAITTKDERNVAGVLVRESKDSVLLRSSSGDVEVARDDIDTMRNTGRSPMPAGLEAALGPDGLRDVIAYLAGDFAGFRVLNLKPVVTSNSLRGMYDEQRDGNPLAFKKYGVQEIEGVPFEVLDPRRTDSGCNVVVLKGGNVADWESKIHKPQRVEIPVGCALECVHVLGGIGGWAFPYIKTVKPVVKWTWKFADGTSEEAVLQNGVEFADWIGPREVPGSKFVEGLLAEDSWGQVRYHSLTPKAKKVVDSIVLESYDNEIAPTFVALTAELPGAVKRQVAKKELPPVDALDVLLFGGGSSHDFDKYYDKSDRETLGKAGIASTRYTSSFADATRQFEKLRALVLSTNQPGPTAEFQKGLMDFAKRGGGLLIYHPGCWFNWTEWPEYNTQIVGGGASSHEKLQEFEVRVVDAKSELTKDVPSTFKITDELYRFAPNTSGPKIHVLAIGHSLETGIEYPIAWVVERDSGRTVGLTLGHDDKAHDNPAFQKLFTNCVRWITQH